MKTFKKYPCILFNNVFISLNIECFVSEILCFLSFRFKFREKFDISYHHYNNICTYIRLLKFICK